jgi:hypothetical protein
LLWKNLISRKRGLMGDRGLAIWGGTAAIVAAVLWICGAAIKALAPLLTSESILWGQALYFGAFVMMPPALLGIYHPQLLRGGRLAFAGYTLAGIGAVLNVASTWWGMVPQAGSVDVGPAGLVTPAAAYLFSIGIICFAWANWRAGMLSKWGAQLMMAGAAVGLLSAGWLPLPPLVWTVGSIIGGTGLAWLGASLLRYKSG